MPYVQLTATKHIRKAGTTRTYSPGDWVNVGKQVAMAWIAEGSATNPAEVLDLPKDVLHDRSGVVVRGSKRETDISIFNTFGRLLRFTYGAPMVRYEHTLIWDPSIRLWPGQILLGFSRIQKTREEYDAWEIAVMLASNTALARDIGSSEEQRRTRDVVGDLRLPVYGTKAIWARNTPAARQTILKWATALKEGEHSQHAFLRAVYTEQPLICTLPAGWLGSGSGS